MGNLDGDTAAVQRLAREVPCVVISVDYRLAPEHPFPAAVEDALLAAHWIFANAHTLGVDTRRLAVYGASAGATIASGATLMARAESLELFAFQMLVYPMLDDRSNSRSSHDIVGLGTWSREANCQSWDAYLTEEIRNSTSLAIAAPARQVDMSQLPPAYIEVGELDLFRDEAIGYAARLLEHRVPTELHVYPGGVHGSENWAPQSELAGRLWAYRTSALRRVLGDSARLTQS